MRWFFLPRITQITRIGTPRIRINTNGIYGHRISNIIRVIRAIRGNFLCNPQQIFMLIRAHRGKKNKSVTKNV